MKPINLLLVALLVAPPLAHADLVELVRIYGPPGGIGFGPMSGPGDVNQDGYDDFVISAPRRDRTRYECENGYARLYFGGNPIDTSNYVTIPAVCNPDQFYEYGFGRYSAKVGDVNGDGYPDFLVGDPYYDYSYWGPWYSGAGFVYWGGAVIDTLPGLRLLGHAFNAQSHFCGLGDVNGDSYNDIVASMAWLTRWRDDGDSVNIYLGGELPDSLPDFQIWPFFGHYPVAVSPIIVGDYNGDQVDDILLSEPEWELGCAYMFFGSQIGFSNPDLTFGTEGQGAFGSLPCGCGDLNGDGYDDMVIADWHSAYIYFGSDNPDTVADLTLVDDEDSLSNISYIASGGDLNMDGLNDIAMSNASWSRQYQWQGRVYIYYGGTEMDSIPDIVLTGDSYRQSLGVALVFPGDLNRDGYPEFMVTSANSNHLGYSFVTIYTTNVTSVEGSEQVPQAAELELRAYPNPFNTSTVISYKAQGREAKLEIFDLAGRKVKSFSLGEVLGEGQVVWDGTNETGHGVSSGIYFCKLTAGGLSATKKLVLIR